MAYTASLVRNQDKVRRSENNSGRKSFQAFRSGALLYRELERDVEATRHLLHGQHHCKPVMKGNLGHLYLTGRSSYKLFAGENATIYQRTFDINTAASQLLVIPPPLNL